MKFTSLEEQAANTNVPYMLAPYVRMAKEILDGVRQVSERAADLIEQKLDTPELSLENCGGVLLEYIKAHSGAACSTDLTAENPVIQIVLDFYEIPSAWVFDKAQRTPVRTVDMVTAEIQLIQAQVKKVFYDAVIQIGTRLLEVKELVPHGEWTSYLENRLGYKPSTAQNYMRIAKEFGDGQVSLDGTDPQSLFGELGYAQLLPLLSLPDEERRTLAQENDLPAMSSREIEELVKAQKAAEDRAKQAESELQKAERSVQAAEEREANALAAQHTAEQRADKLQEEHTFLQNRLQVLTEQVEQTPIQAEVVPSEAELEQAREEVREKMQAALNAAEDRASKLEEAQTQLKSQLDTVHDKLEKVKNPAAMRVNLLFEDLQIQMDKLFSALAALQAEQPETGDKFRTAIYQYLALYNQRS